MYKTFGVYFQKFMGFRYIFMKNSKYKGNISVRITGYASFKVDSLVQVSIYQGSDILKRLYRSPQDLAYFSVSIDSLDYYDLSTNPPTFCHYDGTTGEFQSLNPFGKH